MHGNLGFFMSYSMHKITHAPREARLLIWHAKTPASPGSKRRFWTTSISLLCETSDVLKIHICWPPFSAPYPILRHFSCHSGAFQELSTDVRGDAAAKTQQQEAARNIEAHEHFQQQTSWEATRSSRDGEHKTPLFRSSLCSYWGNTWYFT